MLSNMFLIGFLLIVSSTAFPVDIDELTFTEERPIGFVEVQQLNLKDSIWHYQRTEYGNGAIHECRSDMIPRCNYTGSAKVLAKNANVTQMKNYDESDAVGVEMEGEILVSKFFCQITANESKCTVSYGYKNIVAENAKNESPLVISWFHVAICATLIIGSVMAIVYSTVLISNFIKKNAKISYNIHETEANLLPNVTKM